MSDNDILNEADSGGTGVRLAELGSEMRTSFLEYSMSVIHVLRVVHATGMRRFRNIYDKWRLRHEFHSLI